MSCTIYPVDACVLTTYHYISFKFTPSSYTSCLCFYHVILGWYKRRNFERKKTNCYTWYESIIEGSRFAAIVTCNNYRKSLLFQHFVTLSNVSACVCVWPAEYLDKGLRVFVLGIAIRMYWNLKHWSQFQYERLGWGWGGRKSMLPHNFHWNVGKLNISTQRCLVARQNWLYFSDYIFFTDWDGERIRV